MVGHLTLGKKKYLELSSDIKNEFEKSFNHIETIQNSFLDLVDEDTLNYNLVMSAFKLPKDTEEEKQERSKKIEEATIKATKTPFKMVELASDLLKHFDIFVQYGNKNAISDIGVASLLALAGIKGAIYNVCINLSSISDEAFVLELKEKCEKYSKEANSIALEIEKKILSSF